MKLFELLVFNLNLKSVFQIAQLNCLLALSSNLMNFFFGCGFDLHRNFDFSAPIFF